MDREEIGVHTVCVKERFIFDTGPAAEPHADADGVQRCAWAEFDEESREDLGWRMRGA